MKILYLKKLVFVTLASFIATSWTYRHGNINSETGQSSLGRVSSTDILPLGIDVGDIPIGSTTNETWSSMPVNP